MGNVLAMTVLSGGAFVVAILLFLLGSGLPAAGLAVLNAIVIGELIPLFIRREPWPNRIPAPPDVALSVVSTLCFIAGALLKFVPLFWGSALILSVAAFRIAWFPFRSKEAPPGIKAAMAMALATVVALNLGFTAISGLWALQWNEQLAWLGVKTGVPTPEPTPTPAPPPEVDLTPVAKVGAKPITRAMLDYQMYIDRAAVPGEEPDPVIALASLLHSYTALRVLEKKYPQPDLVLDLAKEANWIHAKVKDAKVLAEVRKRGGDAMFYDVFVGANGLYVRRLREVFEKAAKEELRAAAADAVSRAQAADGKPQSLEELTGIGAVPMWYSSRRRDFFSLFESDDEPKETPDPRDPLLPELQKLAPQQVLPKPVVTERFALIVRRIADSAEGRRRYEVARLKLESDFDVWFAKESRGVVIDVPDPALRAALRQKAVIVRHLIMEPTARPKAED